MKLCFLEEECREQHLSLHEAEVYGYSERCPGKARPNEDGAAVYQVGETTLLVVADGLGGQPGADQASRVAVTALEEGLAQAGSGELRDSILSAIEVANDRILALDIGAGTTLAIAEVSEGTIRPYHVGDSMVLAVSRRGELILETIPHSPIGYALAAGLIDEEQALRHPDRHIISNMVGSSEMRVEVGSPVPFDPGDTILVASDGVTDNLRMLEMIELLRGGTVRRAGPELIELCRDRMAGDLSGVPSKPDDLTALVYRSNSS